MYKYHRMLDMYCTLFTRPVNKHGFTGKWYRSFERVDLVIVYLFSNWSQMTSKFGKNLKVAKGALAECVTRV